MKRRVSLLLVLCMILGVLWPGVSVLAGEEDPVVPITPNGAPVSGVIQPGSYLETDLSFRLERASLVTVTARFSSAASYDLYKRNLCAIIFKDDLTGKQLKDGSWEYTCSMYLEAGTHRLSPSTNQTQSMAVSYSISLKADPVPASKTDPEPNNSQETAAYLPLSKTVHGLISDGDIDYYYFKLSKPSTVEFTAKQYKCRLDAFHTQHLSSKYNLIPHHPRKASQSLTTKFRMTLPAGTHYLRIHDASNARYPENKAKRTGFYDFKVRVVGELKPSIYMKMPSKVAAGTKVNMIWYSKPRWIFDEPKLKLSNSGVASYNPDRHDVDGYGLTALKPGKVKVTAYLKGAKKVTKTLTVVENKYALKQPKMPKKQGVYMAHKLLRYSNGMIRGEIYLLNKTKYTIHGITDMSGIVYERGDYQRMSGYVGDWMASKPIRPGKVGVIQFRIPVRPGEVPNFLSKRYYAGVRGDLLVSGAGNGISKSYQPLEFAPMGVEKA